MPVPTPFHPRTSALCESLRWKDWAGYHAVCFYGDHHEPEYHAVRQAAGLLDVTPLYKVLVSGPDATEFLAFVSARDTSRLQQGQVGYGCWCNEEGQVLDDGTVTRWDDQHYRVTTADPSAAHFRSFAKGFDVTIEDVTDQVASLAVQGPASRAILAACCEGGIEDLKFFWSTSVRLAGVDLEVTRTGYTGDLGYELWMPNDHALTVWDALIEAGEPHGMLPIGLNALDVCRIEAGFILLGVDYYSARRCMAQSQVSTPYELGLGWSVHLKNRGPFVGHEALRKEKAEGSAWRLVALDIDWDELESLFDEEGLPPCVPMEAWRTAVPVYSGNRQIGRATSGVFSPLLKKNIALASVKMPHGSLGEKVSIETTVEFRRRRVTATVVDRPCFDPERKRS